MLETSHRVSAEAETAKGPDERANSFLRAMPAESYARLAPELEIIELRGRVVLWEPDRPIKSVYFPHTCVIVDHRSAERWRGRGGGNSGTGGSSGRAGAEDADETVRIQLAAVTSASENSPT